MRFPKVILSWPRHRTEDGRHAVVAWRLFGPLLLTLPLRRTVLFIVWLVTISTLVSTSFAHLAVAQHSRRTTL